MTITATLIEDKDTFVESADDNDRGMALSQHWLVTGTRRSTEALNHPDVPQVGDAYGVSEPGLVVMSRSTKVLGGNPGAVRVKINYADEARASNGKPPPPAGPQSNYTEIEFATRSTNIRWGWSPFTIPDGTTVADQGPINDGDGLAREYSVLILKLTLYRATTASFPFFQMMDLALYRKQNTDEVTVPKLRDSASTPGGTNGLPLTFLPGQLRFIGFTHPKRVKGRNGTYWFEYQVTLEAAENFLAFWEKKNAQGKPYMTSWAHVIPGGSFTGLW